MLYPSYLQDSLRLELQIDVFNHKRKRYIHRKMNNKHKFKKPPFQANTKEARGSQALRTIISASKISSPVP